MARCRRAAHFLLHPVLSMSPPNEAMISAYLELGLEVDLYAPGGACDVAAYGGKVGCHDVAYGRQWLIRNAFRPGWRRYSVFSGTSENPLGVVGVLSRLARRPSIALVDEIRSGAYRGNAPESWKRLCRSAMRHAAFDIVNDECRVSLLRDYAGLDASKKVIVYPGGYREPPPPVDRAEQRRRWGFSTDALVVGYSGVINIHSGADWLIAAMQKTDFRTVMQAVGIDPLAGFLLERIEGRERMYIEKERLGWREAWSQAAAMDIGVVVYNNPGPQFHNMGVSSNRLCMFLAMGVPVIASRQDSFRFIEQYDCGVLVEDGEGFVAAVDRIAARLPEMRANALTCWREYVATDKRYAALRDEIRRVVS